MDEELEDELLPDGIKESGTVAVCHQNLRRRMVYRRFLYAVLAAQCLVVALVTSVLFMTPGVRAFVQQHQEIFLMCLAAPIASGLIMRKFRRVPFLSIVFHLLHTAALTLFSAGVTAYFDMEVLYLSAFINFFMFSLLSTRPASYIARKNYFEVLGIDRTASKEDIKKAFVEKTNQLHPDSGKSKAFGDSRVGWAAKSQTEQFMLVKEAYDVLRNDEKRKAYESQTFARDGFLMEATSKKFRGSTIVELNAQRNESYMGPNRRGVGSGTHFRDPEEEYFREKRRNRMLLVLFGAAVSLIAANILFVRYQHGRKTRNT
ncbi:unnamed protein product [Caenorhabditis auriculariae]|uniref:J domain-containing protein n=1 Tax=Caenorhabditis auriculariae TaxID=2777116 RepID=A0A8S1H083_9PELO|nr:unnamed protein product [Caenorhabditis auriculariae]